jgi:3D (Asp-Asp-Asp) domain-containing protein
MKHKTIIINSIMGLIICTLLCGTVYLGNQYYKTSQHLTDTQDHAVFIQSKLDKTKQKLQKQIDANTELQHELSLANQTINDLQGTEYKLVYIGNFKYTYYCDERRPHICGGSGITASGAPTKVGTTIGVDPSVIPLGTTVYMEGLGFRVAQDTGNKVSGKHIDVLVKGHNEALSQTLLGGGVWILVKNS